MTLGILRVNADKSCYSQANRLLSVMFTERGGRIRIISARTATRRERKDYEEG